MENLHDLRRQQFEKLENEIATKDCISNLMKIIEDQNKKINMMENKVAVLKRDISQLQIVKDNLEQYQRRLCLRISGIDLPPHGMKESADDCLDKVKHVFAELGVKVPEEVIDRAHRVGKATDQNGKSGWQMIVGLTTWRNRTMIYRGRKNVTKYRVKHDFTKKQGEVLKNKNDYLE
eukprot:gene10179-18849_t